MRTRLLVLIGLFAVGLASAMAAVVAKDVTWKAIWIGLTSTTIAAGLVDSSALWETHKRERVLLRVVGVRVGRIHQRLLWIIGTIFDVSAEAREVPGLLRAWEPRPIDLTEDAKVLPPRSKEARVAQCIDDIDDAMDVVLALGAQTSQAERMERLDDALRSRAFMVYARTAIPCIRDGGDRLAAQAADLLEEIQVEFRYFSERSGPTWKFGQLDPPPAVARH
jgi:hypothetical protein